MSAPADRNTPPTTAPLREEQGYGGRAIGVVRQWLGTNGDGPVTSGRLGRTFVYGLVAAATIVGATNCVNVITIQHSEHRWFGALVTEGSSWITMLLFFWIVWVTWRIAPPTVRPRWKLLVHVPGAFAFSLAHVGGFVLLRKLAFWLAGGHYIYGAFLAQFSYEFRKDAFGYVLFTVGFSLIDHHLRQQALIGPPGQLLTYDIRDGGKLTRVRLDQILAITSAGNYVEFVLSDRRRLLMRSPLSALERELSPCGFLRTHRSWILNTGRVTALKPEGSGDYTVELGDLSVPLSRRFPEALARIRSTAM